MKHGASGFGLAVGARGFRRAFLPVLLAMVVAFCCAEWSHAQGNGLERTFPQSKANVEKVLREMQSATAGRLPVLEGFATSDHPLDRLSAWLLSVEVPGHCVAFRGIDCAGERAGYGLVR